MHICFASLDYPDETGGGGVGTYVQAMGRELVKKGHHVSVIAPRRKNSSSEIIDDEGVRIYLIRVGNLHWYVSKIPWLGRIFSLPLRELEYSYAVLRAIREIDRQTPIDIVEGTETGVFFFYRLRSRIGKVVRLHGETYTFKKYTPPGNIPADVRLSRYLQRRALLRADLLTSPSNAHAEEVRSELKNPTIPVKIIPNPLPDSVFASEGAGRKTDKPMFLYVGRLEKSKGIISLLKAIPRILDMMPQASFVFAGNRHPSLPSGELEKIISDMNIGTAVSFPGHVALEELKTYYLSASAVVLPSYYETFGYVYVEALMHGVPLIAFDVGIAREFISHEKNGFLVPVDDIGALADYCVRSVGMEVAVPSEQAFARYRASQICRDVLKLYDQLLYPGSSPRPENESLGSGISLLKCTADYKGTSNAGLEDQFNIFLSPHFDDAVFSCGGLMNEFVKQGSKNVVITLFGGQPDISALSPFARQIHNKWKSKDPVTLRMNEDRKALEIIGAEVIHLNFLDCIYRKTEGGIALYDSYEDMKGPLHPDDQRLCDDVYETVRGILQRYETERVQVLAPLGIGNHVDHQIAYKVSWRLIAGGYRASFYEEFPYSSWYPEELWAAEAIRSKTLSSQLIPIEIETKLTMVKQYSSQLAGIGGSYRKASNNFKEYAVTVGKGIYAERIWLPVAQTKGLQLSLKDEQNG